MEESLEKKVLTFITECVRFHDNRIYVAGLFAKRVARYNWGRLQIPIESTTQYKDNFSGKIQRKWDNLTSFAGENLKRPLCKLTVINSFSYALFALDYSKEKGFYWNY